MSEDLLDRATRALRESSEAPNLRAGATRARLLASAERKYAPRRRVWLTWSLAIATLFASGTAMAARLAGGLPELWRAVALAAWVGPERSSSSQRKAAPRRKPAPALGKTADDAQPPRAEPSPAPTQTIAEPQLQLQNGPPVDVLAPNDALPRPSRAADVARQPAHTGTPHTRERRRPPSRTTTRAARMPDAPASPAPRNNEDDAEPEPRQPVTQNTTVADAAATNAALQLFRRAEQLHRQHDPRALAAWEAYLSAAPQGPLAPEARYNRALTLVRLRKLDAARDALTPFAEGREGGYRRDQARALLQRLRQQ